MKAVLITLIRAYQFILAPLLGPCCRFYPSCSAYCIEAIRQYGAAKGMVLGVRRLCRCHPFCPGGFDPVPAEKPH